MKAHYNHQAWRRLGGPDRAMRSTCSTPLFSILIAGLLGVGLLTPGAARPGDLPAPLIGANKFDLVSQYLGTASGGDGSPAYARVTRAMARKSMDDARDVGIRMFRSAATGFSPRVLDYWTRNPDGYWRIVDSLLDDLHERGISWVPVFMWNSDQFPQFANDTFDGFLRNPDSRSAKLFDRYIREFVQRYRNHPALQFYELTNELNLRADLDMIARCKSSGRQHCDAVGAFSSDDMIRFGHRITRLIRSLDPDHRISSGYSVPRPAAWHLWKRRGTPHSKADWTPDTADQLEQYLRATHAPFDIISVHIYENKANARFGEGDSSGLVRHLSKMSERIGKPLFIGEFGATTASNLEIPPFFDSMLSEIATLGIPYSAIWAWELYQSSVVRTRTTKADKLSLEPGYTDGMIRRLMEHTGRASTVKKKSNGRDDPPRVVLTSPFDCSDRTRLKMAYAVASDDSLQGPIVTFKLNGAAVGTVKAPPYKVQFKPSQLRSTGNVIQAEACDTSGNCAISQLTRVVGRSERCEGDPNPPG